MIAIIDYGAGNLLSVEKAIKHLGFEVKIIDSPKQLKNISRVILPGVGAFGSATAKLQASGFDKALKKWVQDDKPLLGICLGMQLFMELSEETDNASGIGFIEGTNLKFTSGKVPQIGWNAVKYQTEDDPIFNRLQQNSYFYFVHSYYVRPRLCENSVEIASTSYHIEFPSVIKKRSAYGVQFHPEKSGKNGLRLLKNWVELC